MRRLLNFAVFAGLFAVSLCLFAGTARAQMPAAPTHPPAPYDTCTVYDYQAYEFYCDDTSSTSYGYYMIIDQWDLGSSVGFVGSCRYIGPQIIDTSVYPVSPNPNDPRPDPFSLTQNSILTYTYFLSLQDPGSTPFYVTNPYDD